MRSSTTSLSTTSTRGLDWLIRVPERPDAAGMGASLYELAPDAPEMRMHMHFGAEEMFFVLSGRPLFRNQHGEEELAPGDFVF